MITSYARIQSKAEEEMSKRPEAKDEIGLWPYQTRQEQR